MSKYDKFVNSYFANCLALVFFVTLLLGFATLISSSAIMFALSLSDKNYAMKKCIKSGKSAVDCEWIWMDYK